MAVNIRKELGKRNFDNLAGYRPFNFANLNVCVHTQKPVYLCHSCVFTHLVFLHSRCVCVSGRTAADGKSCVNETGFLVVSGKKRIEFLSANPLGRPPPFKPVSRRLRSVAALDFDFESKLIYFADSGRRAAIKAVFLNGTGLRVVVGGMFNLFLSTSFLISFYFIYVISLFVSQYQYNFIRL